MRIALTILLLAAATLWPAELPVKTVILYKHGVGYFERAGELAKGEGARLDFKASEMNDVLKSLTVEVKGGAVSGLRYDSSEPLARKLEDLPIHLEPQQSISALLDQLKGARLEVKFATSTAAGAIISARLAPGSRDQNEREQVTLLRDNGELVTVDLAGASSIRLPDPSLQAQLSDYLTAVNQSRSREKRSVYIEATDAARRQVIASYMVPTPVWKSSYRLIFGATGEPMLEGWAIVDNTTGEDWTGVGLALVSGRPISFQSRLYEPRYIERPLAELPEERAQAPVLHQGAIAELRAEVEAKEAGPRRMAAQRLNAPAGLGGVVGGVAGLADELSVQPMRQDMASSLANTSSGKELGDLFEYRFDKPVTVRKKESVMLPFLQQKLTSRKLIIYNDTTQQNPLHSFELSNTTGKTLDGGPITVFDSGAYAGEALMDTLKQSDKRMISYGVDLGTRVTTKFGSSQTGTREVHMRRGVLQVKTAVNHTTNYTIHNVDAKPKTLVVEQAARPAFQVLSPKPSQTTANANRFEVPLAAGETKEFTVTQENIQERSYGITNLTPDFLLTLIQNKEITPAARKQLESIHAAKRKISDADNALQATERESREITQDQERIRQNIASLSRIPSQQEQVQKYANELAARETRIAALRDQLSELRTRKTALESELSTLIEKMEF
ncbi:MAG: DUF4139 domain-containing protein [Acidobacteriia bacterium]|nr:DUF4139 domain-containing protein [Terriglobia bacterium]